MSTEQHEALKLADWLAGMVCIHPQVSEDDPGGYATEYDQKVDEGRLTIIVQHALIVQMAEALEVISANDEYETEYDGRMYTKCHSCRYDELKAAYQDELKGHQDDCEYIAARTVLAAATQYLKGPKT